MSTVAEISEAIARLSPDEQAELLKAISPNLKGAAKNALPSLEFDDATVARANARSMLGFAKKFHPNDNRSSDEILKELREGDLD